MEEQQELRLEVQRRTNLVEETQKPDDETTPSTATSFVPRLTTGMKKLEKKLFSDFFTLKVFYVKTKAKMLKINAGLL